MNECFRYAIACVMTALGYLFARLHNQKIRNFENNQKQLRTQYGVNEDTPILDYGPELKELIQAASERFPQAKYAKTSGSTAEPKRILYPNERIKRTKFTFIDNLGRCFISRKLSRKVLYVFSALSEDESLTGMLLDDNQVTPYISGLQAPYRLHRHPTLQEIERKYGPYAARFFVIVLSNPGLFYSTNPSTLSTFLTELTTNFERTRSAIYDYYHSPEAFELQTHKIRKRIQSSGWRKRFELIAKSKSCPPIQDMFPGLVGYFCWTGGYVAPFLEHVEEYLPREKYLRFPMYSMSTEVIETVSHYCEKTHFLPLGHNVLYEFLPISAEEHPDKLLKPHELKPSEEYTMIVSDEYGLRRYQTDDVFLCRSFVEGLPDLSFVRRRSLEYSFTGEKLTAIQLSEVYQKLREQFVLLNDQVFLSCCPSLSSIENLPHYKLIIVGAEKNEIDEIENSFDILLKNVNSEYEAKRSTGRLGRPQAVFCDLEEVVRRTASAQRLKDWESQFKFLPLYRTLWESKPSASS